MRRAALAWTDCAEPHAEDTDVLEQPILVVLSQKAPQDLLHGTLMTFTMTAKQKQWFQ